MRDVRRVGEVVGIGARGRRNFMEAGLESL